MTDKFDSSGDDMQELSTSALERVSGGAGSTLYCYKFHVLSGTYDDLLEKIKSLLREYYPIDPASSDFGSRSSFSETLYSRAGRRLDSIYERKQSSHETCVTIKAEFEFKTSPSEELHSLSIYPA